LAYQTVVHPQTIDLGLCRLEQVLGRLDWRQPRVPVISIAGTNGKGSVAAYCTSILSAAGYRVGTFTSPHLRDYRERIRVGADEVESELLVRAFERIETARGAVSLTFFEYNALAAFLIFDAAKLDAWVLEIGMGGRLDAVNVIDPSVSVIVSIGLDHQEFLGSTLEEIAREKAGIFRRDAPAVLASEGMPRVLETLAREVGAPLKRVGIEYRIEREAERWRFRGARWDLAGLPAPALFGETQYSNAAAAIAALEALEPRLPVSADAIAQGLEVVQLVGRFQVLPGEPTWILDVAHNPDAARVLARNLRARPTAARTLAVCAMLADKDSASVARELRDCIDAWWLSSLEGARGLSSEALAARIAPEIDAPVFRAATVADACEAALSASTPADRIVVFGSFHTVGPALDWLEARREKTAESTRK
jgi:dihydrofolate synthase/folylpolyglutamate synthase